MVRELSECAVAILAGGMGTRLQEALPHLPKGLAPVLGRPFLVHLLAYLAAQGIHRAVLCTGDKGDHIEAALGSRAEGIDLVYSREQAPLGTAGALALARGHLGTGPVLVLNGDSLVHADLRPFLDWYRRQDRHNALLLVDVPDVSRFGAVVLDASGRVVRFGEKQGRGPGLVNAGVYLLGPELLATIPRGTFVSLERDVFPARVERDLHGYPVQAPFLDIGTSESYRQAEAFLARIQGAP